MEGTPIAALATFIAGRFSATYNAVDVGITRQGHEIEITLKQETINESDLYGLTTVDAVVRGGDAFYQAEFREYKSGSISCFTQPFTAAAGGIFSTAKPIGGLASGLAQALVMTATANTPAAATPATLTASLALLAEGYPVKLLFDSRLRPVPIRMQLYPSVSTGTGTWYTQT